MGSAVKTTHLATARPAWRLLGFARGLVQGPGREADAQRGRRVHAEGIGRGQPSDLPSREQHHPGREPVGDVDPLLRRRAQPGLWVRRREHGLAGRHGRHRLPAPRRASPATRSTPSPSIPRARPTGSPRRRSPAPPCWPTPRSRNRWARARSRPWVRRVSRSARPPRRRPRPSRREPRVAESVSRGCRHHPRRRRHPHRVGDHTAKVTATHRRRRRGRRARSRASPSPASACR